MKSHDEDFATIRRLRVFAEVADRLSFSTAARSLSLTQPAVSSHIRALERKTGGPLFDHRRQNLALTEAGRTLYSYTQRFQAAWELITEAAACRRFQ